MFRSTKDILKTLDFEKVMYILSLNEISGNTKIAYRFSKAVGGTSGYSFGRSQFDVSNNKNAVTFLKSNGFTQSDINRLLRIDKNISDLNTKLASIKDAIDKYDEEHVKSICTYVANLEGLPPMTEKTFVHLVDYHNQFSLSRNGKMHTFLKNNPNYLLSFEVYEFKIENTKWGRENPRDVKRRYKTIERYYDEKEEK